MTPYILVICFLVNGQPTELHGYGPRRAPDLETCVERGQRLHAYVKRTMPGYAFAVQCQKLKGVAA